MPSFQTNTPATAFSPLSPPLPPPSVKRGVQLKFGEKNSLNPPRSLVICAEDSLIALPAHVLVESDNTHPDVSIPSLPQNMFSSWVFSLSYLKSSPIINGFIIVGCIAGTYVQPMVISSF